MHPPEIIVCSKEHDWEAQDYFKNYNMHLLTISARNCCYL
jgi:hypothetical protein